MIYKIFKDVLVRSVVLMALTSALLPVFLYLPNTSFFFRFFLVLFVFFLFFVCYVSL